MGLGSDHIPVFSVEEVNEAILDLDVHDAITVLEALDKIAEDYPRSGHKDGYRSRQFKGVGDVFVVHRAIGDEDRWRLE